jgi:hypothetical protein
MIVNRVRNVHEALFKGMAAIALEGVERPSRNGPVLQFPEPVCTVYERPLERVVFWDDRDCNPFFHFFESLWMLAGRDDVAFLAQFVPRMAEFSDDGQRFHGAYGYRWRHHSGNDQLPVIIDHLRKNRDDRRQVLSMWNECSDLYKQDGMKDLPCNLQVIFQVATDGRLDMTDTNRSNDMIWGAYGANAVHFSYLHEFMSAAIGVPTGIYRQVSNNLHVYTENPVYQKTARILLQSPYQPYEREDVEAMPITLAGGYEPFLYGVQEFLDRPDSPPPGLHVWLRRVAMPMWNAWRAYSDKQNVHRFNNARDAITICGDAAWRRNVEEWLKRRHFASFKKAQQP